MRGNVSAVRANRDYAAQPLSAADTIRDLAGFPCTKKDEERIANILVSHRGKALQTLIAEINQKSAPSFDDIIFDAIDNDAVRNKIIAHLNANAYGEYVIISDFDDTAVPRHDTRFGDHFPGVPELYKEIDSAYGGLVGDFHLVSARPGIIAGPTADRLLDRGFHAPSIEASAWGPYIKNYLWKFITFQWGSFGEALRDSIIENKFRSIEQQIKLHPGQQLVLFGDTVQWDPEVYAKIREKYPNNVKAIVIHEVPDTDMNPARFKGMVVTTTALQSAEALQKIGVIDLGALDRVRSAMG